MFMPQNFKLEISVCKECILYGVHSFFYYVRLVFFCASKLILSEYTQIFTSHILKKM